jgi:acyl carrier protein
MKGDLEPLKDEDRLFQNDRLDSLDAVELVMSIEEKYGIDLSDTNYFEMTLLELAARISVLRAHTGVRL